MSAMGEQSAAAHLRRGALDDAYPVHLVTQHAFAGLRLRQGLADAAEPDPAAVAEAWDAHGRDVYTYLAEAAAHFWVAEQAGQVVGTAIASQHDGMRVLNEFAIHPAAQSHGIGRALLDRAFAADQGPRSLLATADRRALARYLKCGLTLHFPVFILEAAPAVALVETDLAMAPLAAAPNAQAALASLDHAILGYRRPDLHRWLQARRPAYLYLRGGQAVGYGYTGARNGPFVLLDVADFPAVLAHAEQVTAESGAVRMRVFVPTVNQVAMRYLLDRGFQIADFTVYYMADTDRGRFANYLFISPLFDI